MFEGAVRHVNNIPRMQFLTGISTNTQSKCYHRLSVSGFSKIMYWYCGILINMHNYSSTDRHHDRDPQPDLALQDSQKLPVLKNLHSCE